MENMLPQAATFERSYSLYVCAVACAAMVAPLFVLNATLPDLAGTLLRLECCRGTGHTQKRARSSERAQFDSEGSTTRRHSPRKKEPTPIYTNTSVKT
jgi:hypothetical protein